MRECEDFGQRSRSQSALAFRLRYRNREASGTGNGSTLRDGVSRRGSLQDRL